ncbi:relaxase [Trinickia symbiotica]|uniref:Relaxase n=1 Tax=Trinickia symbiotica TaxID=863227 RepID=A0A2T3XMP2_9BURK|nr:MobH family relaxase [Trinickia symbiotica]PTB17791.1 relaxase [Trinickia symbiotica]
MTTLDIWLAGGALASVAGFGALHLCSRRKLHGKAARPDMWHAAGRAAIERRASPSSQHLAVLEPAELVACTAMQPRVERIREGLGFAPENWVRDVAPLLDRIMEFVQLLPASESHHHAQPGGLLNHSLEVAQFALHFRAAWRLPLGADAEEQLAHAARYSYAVLVAALLHDIGKPMADLRVELVAGHGARAWVPLAGNMKEQGGQWYRVTFAEPAERDYGAHSRLAVVLLHQFVPASALAWLAHYPPVLQELTAYLMGDEQVRAGSDAEAKEGAIARIVKQADRQSVADNLRCGTRTRFATARAVPLIERLMDGLRRLLAEGGVPLNRAGATGYCDGESLWCVAKTLAEAVRKYLAGHEVRGEGAAGIPEDNNRLFDIWQEYGALVSAPDGGAIWTIEVTIEAWHQRFTVLRFALMKLYANPSRYPRALAPGAIRIVEKEHKEEGKEKSGERAPAADAAAANAAGADRSVQSPVSEPAAVCEKVTTSGAATSDATSSRPEPESSASQTQPAAVHSAPEQLTREPSVLVYLADEESAAALLDEKRQAKAQSREAPAQSHALREPMRPKQKVKRPKDPSGAADVGGLGRKPRPNAERFMAWVQEGVASGALAYNESKARVHFVAEGMLVVTPGIFKDFAAAHPEAIEVDPADDGKVLEPWKVVQRDFQKSGYPVAGEPSASAASSKSFLLHYNIKGAGGKQLMVMRVPQPERFFNPVPAPNALIQSKQGCEGTPGAQEGRI